MPYQNDPRYITTDAVRLLVGDISTSTGSEYLTDTDYDYFVSVTSNTFTAAQLAANSLAALFAGAAASGIGANGYIEKKVGDLSLKKADATSMAAGYREISKKFMLMAAAGLSPISGNLSIADKQSNRNDTDIPKPFFDRELFDNPASVNPFSASTST